MRVWRFESRVRGKLIAVEGIDGAGKTTQSYLLVEKLREHGYRSEYTSEPTYGRVGDILRLHVLRSKPRAPVLEALLYAADRYEHVKKTVKPKVNAGVVLVTDRYLYSTLAYQGAAGLDLKWLRELNFFAPKPHLTLYIDVPAGRGLRRKTGVKTIFENLDYEQRVRQLYLKLAKDEGFTVFDGCREVQELHQEILSSVLKFLRKG